jgi:hypothetical protein
MTSSRRMQRGGLSDADKKMLESGRSPNELDQTDESLKAADITAAGEAKAQAGATAAPKGPDGKTAERYAG